jgi:hypothetical protein
VSDVLTTGHSGSRPSAHHDTEHIREDSAVTSHDALRVRRRASAIDKTHQAGCSNESGGQPGRNMRMWELPRGIWIVVEQYTFNEVVLLSAHRTLEEAEIERKNASRLKQCYCMFLKPLRTSRRDDRSTVDLPEAAVPAT